MATPDLPQLGGSPQVAMPDGNEAIASKVAEFGKIVQNFTQKTTAFAGAQVGLQQKASEMVLKTNIDNSMRAFARSSLNQLDPKSGLEEFHRQADEYTNKLLENMGGLHADTIRAYAYHAKETNLQPLHAGVIKQAHNEAKVSFLKSIDSLQKDILQNINNVPFDDVLSHHTAKAQDVPRGMVEQGNIRLDERADVQGGKKVPKTRSMVVGNGEGQYFVIPTVTETGIPVDDETALELWINTKEHYGSFDSKEQAARYSDQLNEGRGRRTERIAPGIDSVNYNLSQALNQIDVAAATGIIKPAQAKKMKDQLTNLVNDEMLSHKFKLAEQMGMGQQFIQQYAQTQVGNQGAAEFAKKLSMLKKSENLDLMQQGIYEVSAREQIKSNLDRVARGEPSNTAIDTMAETHAATFPTYARDHEVHALSGSLYKLLTAGTRTEMMATYAQLQAMTQAKIPESDRLNYQDALDLAIKNGDKYFKEFDADPWKFIIKNNLLGDIAQQEKISGHLDATLPPDKQLPMVRMMDAAKHIMIQHGIAPNAIPVMTNEQAEIFAGQLIAADAKDKVRMMKGFRENYGEYSTLGMQQLITKGQLPKQYGMLTLLDERNGNLQDVAEALTYPEINYKDDQKTSVANRVSKAMNIYAASGGERAHPSANPVLKFYGHYIQGLASAITGREYSATGPYTTGMFNSPQLFDMESSPPDLKIKALVESMSASGTYKSGDIINQIESGLNRVTNYYITARGLSQDDAFAKAVNVMTSHYQMIDYRDNVVRYPKGIVNANDVIVLFTNTPELVRRTNFMPPQLSHYGDQAYRADEVEWFRQNIENGHWMTAPTDDGVIWVGATGAVPRMANGNPLFISFKSISNLNTMTPGIYPGMKRFDSHGRALNALYGIFKENNVAFNEPEFDLQGKPKDVEQDVRNIKTSYSFMERISGASAQRTHEAIQYWFEDKQKKQREFAAKAQGGQ